MNTIKKVLLLSILLFGFQFINAQVKVAHINTDELIAAMPETKTLQAKLEKLGKSYNDEAAKKEAELKTKFEKYSKEFETQTELVNNQRTKEVQDEAKKIEQFKTEAYNDLQKQENEGLAPILEKAQKAIEEVASAQGFDYVINAQTLIVAKGKDLLPDVKAKLGIK